MPSAPEGPAIELEQRPGEHVEQGDAAGWEMVVDPDKAPTEARVLSTASTAASAVDISAQAVFEKLDPGGDGELTSPQGCNGGSTPTAAANGPSDECDDEWCNVLRHSIAGYMEQNPHNFRRMVRRGVPQDHRWQVWKEMARVGGPDDGPLIARYHALRGQRSEYAEYIEADIGRTFQKEQNFTEERRQRVSNVLNAYAAHYVAVGYCQGMNYLVALLAFVTDAEVELFIFFNCLMERFGLSDFYRNGFPLLRRYISASCHVLECSEPALHSHLLHSGVHVSPCLQRWLQALFVNSLPVSAALELWDVLICEGLSVLVPVTVSMLHVVGEALLEKPGSELQKIFRKKVACIAGEEAAKAIESIDRVQVPDYVPAYLEDAGAFSGWWSWLKRLLIPWTARQRGIIALLACEETVDSPPV